MYIYLSTSIFNVRFILYVVWSCLSWQAHEHKGQLVEISPFLSSCRSSSPTQIIRLGQACLLGPLVLPVYFDHMCLVPVEVPGVGIRSHDTEGIKAVSHRVDADNAVLVQTVAMAFTQWAISPALSSILNYKFHTTLGLKQDEGTCSLAKLIWVCWL